MDRRTKYVVTGLKAAKNLWPHLTDRQAAAIGEGAAKLEDAAVSPMFSEAWDAHPTMFADYLTLALKKVAETAPELIRQAPSKEQFVALEIAKLEAKLGRSATATERLVVFRNAAEMDADDFLGKIPYGTKLPDHPSEPAKMTERTTADRDDDVAALDAEVFRRWGKTVHDLSATDRLRYHNAIKKERRITASAEANRAAALADAGGDFAELPPAMRISKFRAAEKAKQNRA